MVLCAWRSVYDMFISFSKLFKGSHVHIDVDIDKLINDFSLSDIVDHNCIDKLIVTVDDL